MWTFSECLGVWTVANIRATERFIQDHIWKTYQGTIIKQSDSTLSVNVCGNIIAARWADPIVVKNGDAVLVQISTPRSGQGEAIVVARLADKARPSEAVVKTVPVSSPTITVTGTDGIDYIATFNAAYTPVVNDKVLLNWNAALPSVVALITAAPVPPPPPQPVAPPPPPPQTGTTPFAASDSDTYWPSGGWGSWAGGGGRVFQGDYGSGNVYGAYFYAGSVAQLAGKTITGIRLTLGSRLAVGSNNAPVVVHFYAHNSVNKPGGNVSLVAGPYDVVAQPGQGLTEYALPPATFAATLQAGGGIAIAFNPYAGFMGRREQAVSGKLFIDWTT
jgi:hypothetical protein